MSGFPGRSTLGSGHNWHDWQGVEVISEIDGGLDVIWEIDKDSEICQDWASFLSFSSRGTRCTCENSLIPNLFSIFGCFWLLKR